MIGKCALTCCPIKYSKENTAAIYSAYFDDSGHPDQGPYVIVSGFLAERGQWNRFEREWKAALKDQGMTIFHATDFATGNGEFESWRKDNRRRTGFLQRLIGVIKRNTVRSFSCAIPLDEFRRVDNQFILKESLGNPYPLAARFCIARADEWAASMNVASPIQYIFEDGTKHKGQLLWVAEKDGKPTPTFKKKHEAVPLQAADMVAWEHNRFLTKLKYNSVDCVTPTFEALESMPNDWGVCTADQLVEMCKGIVEQRNPHLKYTCKIVKKNGKRTSLIRVELKAKWRMPASQGGVALHSFVGQLLSTEDDALSWGVFEEENGEAAQVHLRRGDLRETLVIEKVLTLDIGAAIEQEVSEWVRSTLASDSFGQAPNIRILSR